VIRPDANDEWLPSLQVSAPFAQHVYDREHLPIVCRVAPLCIRELVRRIGDRLQAVAEILLQHGARREVGRVRIDDELPIRVG